MFTYVAMPPQNYLDWALQTPAWLLGQRLYRGADQGLHRFDLVWPGWIGACMIEVFRAAIIIFIK